MMPGFNLKIKYFEDLKNTTIARVYLQIFKFSNRSFPSLRGIIRRLLGYRYIMRMAFAHSGRGNAYKLCFLQVWYVGCAAIMHACAQSAGVLVNNLGKGAFVRDTAYNTLGHQLGNYIGLVLEIAVFRAFVHSLYRAHATVRFKLTAF